MGIHRYRKLESPDVRGICVRCNKNPQKPKSGGLKFSSICRQCDKELYSKDKEKERIRERTKIRNKKKAKPYKVFKKDHCESCGFIPVHSCQLDVDHKNGDHQDNTPDNLQTLCANCHRLKTHMNQDYEPSA